jgi:hypothetical protein
MFRPVSLLIALGATLLGLQFLGTFIGEARSQSPAARQVAPLGASEGVAWYVDLTSRQVVACRLRSDPATLACSASAMP